MTDWEAVTMAVTLPDIAKVEVAIVEMTNTFRRENRLGEVRVNPKLTEAARAYASYLARTGSFSHSADGRSPAERTRITGYQDCLVAENLSLNLDSRGFQTRQLAFDAIEGWKRSPGHRRNLLAEHVTEIGVGVARASDKEQYLSVQVLARPESLSYSFVIRNQSAANVRYALNGRAMEAGSGYELRHTACAPTEINLIEARAGTAARKLNGQFETRDGDIYTVSGEGLGDIVVDHARGDQTSSLTTGSVRTP